MIELQINMAAQQWAELLLMKLKDPETDTHTAISAHIQQMRLLVEPPKLISHMDRPSMRLVKCEDDNEL